MKRAGCLVILISCVCGASAQVPDVLVKVDLRMVSSFGPGRDTVFRSYGPDARRSTVGLTMTLEPGFQVIVAQRLQLISNDADNEQLDESYIEDPGYWRAGKQYLPFGAGRLLVESINAGRVNINVGGDQIPAAFSASEGGKGMPKGITGRIGDKFGVSFAIGENFGVSATSLANVRTAEGSPGKGHGWGRVYGIDYASKRAGWTTGVEVAHFAKGSTALEENITVSDVLFSVSPSIKRSLTLGWCKIWETGEEVFRVEGKQMLATSVWLEPTLRLKSGKVLDLSLVLHVKL